MKTFRNYIAFNIVYLAAFFLARLIFFIFFKDDSYQTGQVIYAFITGARLDMSLTAFFTGWLFFIYHLPKLFFKNDRPQKLAVKTYVSVFNVLILLLLIAEIPFYKQYSSRLNHLFFEYFSKPKEMFVTLAGVPLVWPALLAFLASAFFAVKYSIRFCDRIFSDGGDSRLARVISLVFIGGFTILLIRGGVQRRPINWGAAFFSKYNLLNQTALNGPYNLFQQIQIYLEERGKKVVYTNYFTQEKALDILRGHNTYSEEGPDDIFRFPAGQPKRPNIVVILMESFSGKYIGALGNNQGLSPNFDRLAKEGILFTSFYSNGTRTSRALTSVLCSVPPMPGVNMTKKIEAQQKIPSVAGYLDGHGYNSMFFYGGDRHFEDMSGFALNNGFDVFYDYTDFIDVKYPNPIGVYDEELFLNANRIMSGAKAPFFATIMTLTNHGPFTLPKNFDGMDKDLPQELRTFKYSDWALGRFFEEARKSPYYANTIFFIMADHPAIYAEFSPQRFHIPMLVLSPLLSNPHTDGRTASQMDIGMTILRLAGTGMKSTDTAFWGRSLFERKLHGEAFLLDDPYFGMVTPDAFYRESLSGDAYLFSPDMKPMDNEGIKHELQDYSRAMLQAFRKMFFGDRLSAGWQKTTSTVPESTIRQSTTARKQGKTSAN